jgi:hypothetical protein
MPFWNKVRVSTLKILMVRQCSFAKYTQFSQGNNVLDVPPSNIDGFLSRYAYVSSTQMNWPVETKYPILPCSSPYMMHIFLQK